MRGKSLHEYASCIHILIIAHERKIKITTIFRKVMVVSLQAWDRDTNTYTKYRLVLSVLLSSFVVFQNEI